MFCHLAWITAAWGAVVLFLGAIASPLVLGVIRHASSAFFRQIDFCKTPCWLANPSDPLERVGR